MAEHTPLSTIRFLVTQESTEDNAENSAQAENPAKTEDPAKAENTTQASLQFEAKYALLADLAREK